MSWRRGSRDAPPTVAAVAASIEIVPSGTTWEYLVEEASLEPGWTERRCNDHGTEGWELVGVAPLSRPALASGGRTTSLQLFFKRQLL
jgi:hypothetical protein